MNWQTKGFDAFRRGVFGNGGQNLYVSKKGVLQRIFQYDLNHNGYFDLVFANCQNHHESAESYVYTADGKRIDLPGQGCVSGLAADLYESGYEDIVLCGRYDMAAPYATTDIYFGGPEGWSTDNHIRIPTPWAESVAAGRFKAGRLALAFAMPVYHEVRIFYQTDLGFAWEEGRVDLPIDADQVAAIDLDGDGFDELIAVKSDFSAGAVFWGGPEGISARDFSPIPLPAKEEQKPPAVVATLESNMEKKLRVAPQLRVGVWKKRRALFWSTGTKVIFYAVGADREITRFDELDAPGAIAAAIDGTRIAVAARPESMIFEKGKCVGRVATPQASDVAISAAGIYFASNGGNTTYTCETLLCTPKGREVRRFEGEDTRRVIPLRDFGQGAAVLLVNHFSRSSIGFDRTYVYWGSKNGYSPENRLEVPSHCAVDALCADLDDDGWAELLVGNNSENSLHLDPGHHLHHFGPSGFEPERSRTLKTDIGWGVVAGDFDHDGYLEIATPCNHWRDLRIFYGRDNFETYETIPFGSPNGGLRWILAVDLNNNGWLDLVLPHGSRSVILWGGPEGYSMENSTQLGGYCCLAAAAADLTKNGYPDLILGGHTQTAESNGYLKPRQPHHSYVHIYWNGPEGLSEHRKCVLRGDAADSFAIADFNNDGWLDLFVGSYHGGKDRDINSFLYWNREGHFRELDRDLLYTHSASGAVAADFNEDGWVDLAVANHKVDGDHHGWSAVWWNGPKGFNPERCTKLPTNGPHGMCSTDPGNILDRGPEEYYTSEAFDGKEPVRPVSAAIRAEVPKKCRVSIRFRAAKSKKSLERAAWSEWRKFDAKGRARLPELAPARFWQYQLALGATNSLRTPRITEVDVVMKESTTK